MVMVRDGNVAVFAVGDASTKYTVAVASAVVTVAVGANWR